MHRVRAELDAGEYPTGVTVPKEQMDALALVRDAFHGEWNYKLLLSFGSSADAVQNLVVRPALPARSGFACGWTRTRGGFQLWFSASPNLYHPSVTRPSSPLFAPPCSGVSRRCASAASSKFSFSRLSTRRPYPTR